MKEEFEGIPFSDFMKLRPLRVGMKITFRGIEEKLLIGNATPYEDVSDTSHDGWYMSIWNKFIVTSVEYNDDRYLEPRQIREMKGYRV